MVVRRRFPMLGAVGFDGGLRPAIALAIVPPPPPEEEEDLNPCELLYGHDMELTLTGIDPGPCWEIAADSVDWTSLTGINAVHTLAFVTDHWELTGVGSVGYTFYEDRTDCFDTGGNVTTGTVDVTFTAYCAVDGGQAEFTVSVQTAPFTVGGNTISEQYVFVNGGNDGLGDTMTNMASIAGVNGTGVLVRA